MDEKAALAKRIGAAVREHRRLRGWSQEKLAESAELSTHFVGLVERGQELPSLTTLAGLAVALDVELDELIAGPARTPEPWERDALLLLRGIPAEFRTAVRAMLKAHVAEAPALRLGSRKRR